METVRVVVKEEEEFSPPSQFSETQSQMQTASSLQLNVTQTSNNDNDGVIIQHASTAVAASVTDILDNALVNSIDFLDRLCLVQFRGKLWPALRYESKTDVLNAAGERRSAKHKIVRHFSQQKERSNKKCSSRYGIAYLLGMDALDDSFIPLENEDMVESYEELIDELSDNDVYRRNEKFQNALSIVDWRYKNELLDSSDEEDGEAVAVRPSTLSTSPSSTHQHSEEPIFINDTPAKADDESKKRSGKDKDGASDGNNKKKKSAKRKRRKSKSNAPVYPMVTPGKDIMCQDTTVRNKSQHPPIPWKVVLKLMKRHGWTWRGGTGLMTDYRYVKPGCQIKGGTEKVDYFKTENEAQIFARNVYGWTVQDDVNTVDALERVIQEHAKYATQVVPPLKSTIHPNEPWRNAWGKMLASGWRWKVGSGLMTDYYYVKPGCKIKSGTKGQDYFEREEDMQKFAKYSYGWVGEHLATTDTKEVKLPEKRRRTEKVSTVDKPVTKKVKVSKVRTEKVKSTKEDKEEDDEEMTSSSESDNVDDDDMSRFSEGLNT